MILKNDLNDAAWLFLNGPNDDQHLHIKNEHFNVQNKMLIVLLEPYIIKTNHYHLFKYFYAIARIIMTLNDSEAPVCYFSKQKASHITLSMFILTLQDNDGTDKILGKLFICLAMKSCSLDPINKIQLNKDFFAVCQQ